MNRLRLPSWFYAILLTLSCASSPVFAEYHMIGSDASDSDSTITVVPFAPGNNSQYTFVFQPVTSLTYTGVEREFEASPTQAQYWCKNSGSSYDFSIKMEQASTGLKSPAPDSGNDLYATSVPGLYFSFELTGFRVDGRNEHFTINPTNVSNQWHKSIIYDGDLSYNDFGCKLRSAPKGKVILKTRVRFYTDALFKPMGMATNGINAVFMIRNAAGYGGTMTVRYSMMGLNVSLPTCQAALIDGKSRGSVELGSYSPATIAAGNTEEKPFTLSLRNCIGIRNIETRLTTNFRSADGQLLTNTQSGITSAQGVGVKIMGLANGVTSQPVHLLPNRPTSVYRDYEDETSNRHYIDGAITSQNGATQQDLHFTAQLVRDVGQNIMPGQFSATGVFSISYP